MNRETIYRLIARGELPAARHPHRACASIPDCGITGDHMSERAYRHAPRVLVVEDDTRLLFAIKEALTDAGYEQQPSPTGMQRLKRSTLSHQM